MAEFDEELGDAIVSTWLLHAMTDETPPTVAQLYERLHEATNGET